MVGNRRTSAKSGRISMRAGMTLIEAVVWVSVFASIMFALMMALLSFYHTNHYVLEESSAISSGQRGIDNLVRTLREMSYSSNGAYPIVSIGKNQIAFYSDVTGGGAVEELIYRVQGNSLYEDIVEPMGESAGVWFVD